MGAQGRRTIVVIDDAHRLRSDTLENLKTFKEKGVSILLAAHTQLARKLDLSYYEEAGLRAVINKEKQVSLNTVHEILPNDFSHLWVELRRLGYTALEIAEELNEDKKRVIQCLHGRLAEDDGLYKTIGVFLHGLGIKMASNE